MLNILTTFIFLKVYKIRHEIFNDIRSIYAQILFTIRKTKEVIKAGVIPHKHNHNNNILY